MHADRVREHPKLLPAMSCPYSRYVDSSLTIKKLCDSYVEWREKEPPVPPLNAAIKNDIENQEKVERPMNLQAHKAEGDEAQNLMKMWENNDDADDDDVREVAVGLQQSLPTNRVSPGVSYHKRKIRTSTWPSTISVRCIVGEYRTSNASFWVITAVF